jgi:hypothetical protein
MKTHYLIISVLFLTLIYSCDKKEKDNTTIVYGMVIDSLTNVPLKDVTVQLFKCAFMDESPYEVSGYETTSDTLGKFYLEFESEEDLVSYYIKVSKNGYIYYSDYFDLINIETRKRQNIIVKMLKFN